ncbi:hypothetical protein BDF20DRAFT_843425 [Mycotypha africana]|uniref:uncharacterized protein n=1 Tax=Mycotypha africana TaxID=64632 RepID=UPI0023015B50|nr:uncharacterized protein BDF20DRAFT_843425 [Mycotypha africana]KAI8991227.1 hypothetical protein BDF20DRAFT_843425 [Mycotypha africana]
MGKKDKKQQETDDGFNVLTEITDFKKPDTEAEEKAARKAAKKAEKKKLSKEEREELRKVNRESREKKKQKKELNKKRKRGELVEEEEKEETAGETQPEPTEEGQSEDSDDKPKKKAKTEKPKKEKQPEYGIWVGNLSYSTTVDSIRNFFKDCGTITRVKCPKGNGAKNNNKGFAYIFFATPEEAAKGVALSEQKLEGRALLIKDADNFERADGVQPPTEKEKKEIKKQKNPPCPTLFLGNLSFDTTEKSIREAFEWAGDIRKVRVATFEDSGKCKGFAYVDYFTVESATKAIRAPDKHNLDGRKIRVEFGSAEAHMRSKPWLVRRQKQQGSNNENIPATPASNEESTDTTGEAEKSSESNTYRKRKTERSDGDFREKRPKKEGRKAERVKPGMALSTAQRQKPSVQEFQGTKVVFDNDD